MIDPKNDAEWEVLMADEATNYIVTDEAGVVISDPDMPDRRMGCIVVEARHIETGMTMVFTFRMGRRTLHQLGTIIEVMRERIPL